MKFLIISAIFLSPVAMNAQVKLRNLDSLYTVLNKTESDSTKMYIYNEIAFYYVELNRDSSMAYLDKALAVARKLNYPTREASFLDFRGFAYMLMGNYPRSLESSLMALKIMEDPATEKYFPYSSTETPAARRFRSLSNINYNMGLLFGATGNTGQQIESFRKALDLAGSIRDTFKMAEIKLSLGETYLNINKLDSALLLENEALEVTKISTSADQRWFKYQGSGYWTIGRIYLKQKKFDLAKLNLLHAVMLNKATNNISNLADNYFSLAEMYFQAGNRDSAIYAARQSIEYYKNVSIPKGVAAAYGLLSSVYRTEKNTDSALVFLSLATALKDSLNDAERQHLTAFQHVQFGEQLRLQELEKEKIAFRSKVRIYSLIAGLAIFSFILFLLWKNNKQKYKANKVLEKTLDDLKSTQSQLVQSEKMASLGELTAGIAHEIQNPLNFVNNFSEVSNELIIELKDEKSKPNDERDEQLEDELLNDIAQNLEKINHHGKRADAIVKGMLQHSGTGSGQKELTDINTLTDEYIRLTYHGLRAKDQAFNAVIKTDFDPSIGKINIIPQDIGRVIMNLLTNAFYAVNAKALSEAVTATAANYEPTVSIKTSSLPPGPGRGGALIMVTDNGNGIPQKNIEKIFQPFFTTKPTGQGTGLGLSLSYDIITKGHGGELKVETKQGEGTTFIIRLNEAS